jgi:hypothetical protein
VHTCIVVCLNIVLVTSLPVSVLSREQYGIADCLYVPKEYLGLRCYVDDNW